MPNANQSRNHATRAADAAAPHRTDQHVWSLRSSVKQACEQVLVEVRRHDLHPAMRADLLRAVTSVSSAAARITPDTTDATVQLERLRRQAQHLRDADTWVAAATRTLARMGTSCSKGLRDTVMEAQESVLWRVRSGSFDGDLTGACAALQAAVRDAEAHAARVASLPAR